MMREQLRTREEEEKKKREEEEKWRRDEEAEEKKKESEEEVTKRAEEKSLVLQVAGAYQLSFSSPPLAHLSFCSYTLCSPRCSIGARKYENCKSLSLSLLPTPDPSSSF
eukprot:759814-Hanusia_phi.AAC.3